MILGTKGRLVLRLTILWPRLFVKKEPKGAKLGDFVCFDVEHLLFARF